MKILALALALLASSEAWKLAISKYPSISPGVTSVWTLTETGNWTFVAGKTIYQPALSGAAVCNGVYIAVYADASDAKYGLFSYDLTSKAYKNYATSSLFHKIVCDPKNPGAILGAASDFTFTTIKDGKKEMAPLNAPFHLKRYTLESAKEEVIGSFPTTNFWGGYDNIFEFNEDATELWAGIGKGFQESGGQLQIINVATGNLTTADFPSGLEGHGYPWHITPGKIPGTVSAVMSPAENYELFNAKLTIEGSKIKVKKEGSFKPGFSDEGPWLRCGGKFMLLTGVPSATQVNIVDPDTGAQDSAIDLSGFPGTDPKAKLAGIACIDE